MTMMKHSEVADAIAEGKRQGVSDWQVKQILRKAGFELPNKSGLVTIKVEVDLPDGRALYPRNLTIIEANGIPVRIIYDDDGDALLSN